MLYTRKYSPQEKLTQALNLYLAAKELKRAALRKFHPELSEKQITEKVDQIFRNART